MPTLAYGCGLRAGEVVRLRAGGIDSEQMIIRIVQSKGLKDRHVMLPAEVLGLLRQWWKARADPRMTQASRRNNVGCFPVAVNVGRPDYTPVRTAVPSRQRKQRGLR